MATMQKNLPRTTGAFFGRRKGHKLRPRRARLIETLLPRLAIDLAQSPPDDIASLFPVPVDEVVLEIGFGGGESMIARALALPRTGFLGAEPFLNGMAMALAQIESAGLANVRLHFDDAASLIEWLPAASLAGIDLIHPDPWPKRRHWKRRFVQDEMLVRLARILRPGGELRFVTDVADYAAWTLVRLLRAQAFEWAARSADDWRMPWPGFTPTRYHDKAEGEERPSCFLLFRRC
ncbi:MAG: tRNA (guanine(46)-N(7))-methyltransferase TrmB [Xanthobacteraceae bacterium]